MSAYHVHIDKVPVTEGGPEREGWISMQVQWILGQARSGAGKIVFGRTLLPPGSRHERRRHPHAEEFIGVLEGRGLGLKDGHEEPIHPGDVWFIPANDWHGFRNDTDSDIVMLWGWAGAALCQGHNYPSNRSKGARDPAEWLPALDVCWCATAWIAVKRHYGLSADPAEWEALARVRAACRTLSPYPPSSYSSNATISSMTFSGSVLAK